jgi:hypothetical protein
MPKADRFEYSCQVGHLTPQRSGYTDFRTQLSSVLDRRMLIMIPLQVHCSRHGDINNLAPLV